jgi:hypothetical protein
MQHIDSQGNSRYFPAFALWQRPQNSLTGKGFLMLQSLTGCANVCSALAPRSFTSEQQQRIPGGGIGERSRYSMTPSLGESIEAAGGEAPPHAQNSTERNRTADKKMRRC